MSVGDDLSATLRAAAASGNLTHVSLVPTQNGKMFRGTFAPAKKFGVRFAEHADPVAALLLAMKQDVKQPKGKAKLSDRHPGVLPQPDVDVVEEGIDELL
jgi:hypothetical protein